MTALAPIPTQATAPIALGAMDAAVAHANQWVDTARPIIKAMLLIEDAPDYAVLKALVDPAIPSRRDAMSDRQRLATDTWREARGIIRQAREDLFEMLDGIRDSYLCDDRQGWVTGMSDDEAEAVDAFNDELDRLVVSVDAAVKLVGDEQ